MNKTAQRAVSLLVCLLMMAAAAVSTYGYLAGHNIARGTEVPAFSWGDDWASLLTVKFVATLLVVTTASVLPLFWKNKHYRTVQLGLNVAVTGFWSGAFLSYAFLLGTLAYGIRLIAVVVPVIMLVVAFVYPLFGKRSHYCMWVCPLGSAQELAGKLNPRHKWKMSAATVHRLEVARDVVWALLMLMLWTGIGFAWVDYELFIAFMFRIAPWGVTAAAGVVLLLSVFVSRPYCRFLCPTGNLIRLAQNESK
ncbi:MAG: 4Fe-4S binding protein [Bacteroidaceae bacterium]|nr:4Fe-4S binding protein [Bacteroidaceae bacterium]